MANQDSNPLDVVTGVKPQVEPQTDETEKAQQGQEEAPAPEDQGGEGAQEEIKEEPQEVQEEVQGAHAEVGTETESKPEETKTDTAEETKTDTEKPKPEVNPEYEKLKTDYEQLRAEKEELEALLQEADPLQYFVNENEYKKQQILKKNPDVNPAALDRVLSEDISKMKPEDVLILEFQMENPGADIGEIKEYVLDKYGYNPEDGKVPFGMVADANKARKNLSGYANQEAELPKDIKSVLDSKKQAFIDKIEQSKKQFTPMAEKLAESMEDIAEGGGKDATSYKYDPEFKKQIPDLVMGYLVSEGVTLENAEAGLAGARKMVNEIYKLNNFEKIVKARVDEAVKAKDDEWRAKVHNPQDPNTQTAPEQTSKDTTFEDAERMITKW